jgi:hypothetical protein
MDQEYDRTKNRAIREGTVPMEHVTIGEDGIQRWGGFAPGERVVMGNREYVVTTAGLTVWSDADADITDFEKWWTDLVEHSPMTMFIYHYDGDPGDEHCSRCCP